MVSMLDGYAFGQVHNNKNLQPFSPWHMVSTLVGNSGMDVWSEVTNLTCWETFAWIDSVTILK
mgnify:CR=1 FL=1